MSKVLPRYCGLSKGMLCRGRAQGTSDVESLAGTSSTVAGALRPRLPSRCAPNPIGLALQIVRQDRPGDSARSH